jgi:hypothetical protein
MSASGPTTSIKRAEPRSFAMEEHVTSGQPDKHAPPLAPVEWISSEATLQDLQRREDRLFERVARQRRQQFLREKRRRGSFRYGNRRR